MNNIFAWKKKQPRPLWFRRMSFYLAGIFFGCALVASVHFPCFFIWGWFRGSWWIFVIILVILWGLFILFDHYTDD